MCTSADCAVFQDFLSALSTHFDSSLEEVDFKGDPEGSRGEINDWVEEKTNDKIKVT